MEKLAITGEEVHCSKENGNDPVEEVPQFAKVLSAQQKTPREDES